MPKYRILTGKALHAYLKTHPRLARALVRAHVRALRVRIRVRHPRPKAGLSHRALALASHFVGVKEYPAGSNLTVFGRWYGENGVPWCAIFVSYILSHVGRPFKYAYVPSIVADARAGKNGLRAIPASAVNAAVAAGHPVLACYDWERDGTADHVEFAIEVVAGVVHAVGGNTGPTDWSNGGEVARETRALSLVQAFVEVLG
jgi:hypothetical protein